MDQHNPLSEEPQPSPSAPLQPHTTSPSTSSLPLRHYLTPPNTSTIDDTLTLISAFLNVPLVHETQWHVKIHALLQACMGTLSAESKLIISVEMSTDLDLVRAQGGISLADIPLQRRFLRFKEEARVFKKEAEVYKKEKKQLLAANPPPLFSNRPRPSSTSSPSHPSPPYPSPSQSSPTQSSPFQRSYPETAQREMPPRLSQAEMASAPATPARSPAGSALSVVSDASSAVGVRMADIALYVMKRYNVRTGVALMTGEVKVASASKSERFDLEDDPLPRAALAKQLESDAEEKVKQGLAQASYYLAYARHLYGTFIGVFMLGSRWARLLALNRQTLVLEMGPQGLESLKERVTGTGGETGGEADHSIEGVEGPNITITTGDLFQAAGIVYAHLPNDLSPHGPQPEDSPVPSLDPEQAQRLVSFFGEVRSLAESLPFERALFPLPDAPPPDHLAGLRYSLDALAEVDLARAARPDTFPLAWVEAKKELIRKGQGDVRVTFPSRSRPSAKRPSGQLPSPKGKKPKSRDSSPGGGNSGNQGPSGASGGGGPSGMGGSRIRGTGDSGGGGRGGQGAQSGGASKEEGEDAGAGEECEGGGSSSGRLMTERQMDYDTPSPVAPMPLPWRTPSPASTTSTALTSFPSSSSREQSGAKIGPGDAADVKPTMTETQGVEEQGGVAAEELDEAGERVLGQVDVSLLDDSDDDPEEEPEEMDVEHMMRTLQKNGVQVLLVTPTAFTALLEDKKRKVVRAAWEWEGVLARLARAEAPQEEG
ncbi:hypothetical protein IAT38_006660 [Cryptococcus sp. DSM 104549]